MTQGWCNHREYSPKFDTLHHQILLVDPNTHKEVELDNYKLQASLKHSPHSSSKHTAYADKAKAPAVSDDFRKLSEKLRAMCAYHKSKNLYFTCGDPCARGHKCPDKVPIRVMKELLEVLHLEESFDPHHLTD